MKKFSSIARANSRRTSPIKKRIGVLIIATVILAFLFWAVPQLVSGVASAILTPIQMTKTWLTESSGNLPMYLRDRNELIEEISRLNEALVLQGGEDHSFSILQRENAELRALLSGDGKERIMAAVIGRPNALPYDVLVIDRGSRDGIKENAPVFIGEGSGNWHGKESLQ